MKVLKVTAERNPKVVLQRSTKAVIYETNAVKVVNV